ncbi:BlaI/MecI/CopY family transcriptional regulator [Streptomyces sp. NPDC002870]|uniref:BlaI/MecI/CopY family transcriptional regulator n=1 Tax=Streptomyces sp. NPDC002870 TaxID=3364666 RepID=UPI00367F20B3
MIPSPRRTQKAGNTTAGKATPTRKKSAPKTAGKKVAGKTAATIGEEGPALTDLVHGHLSRQTEPRTAAEVAKALTKAHPDRKISDNAVRTSTERLVARGKVERAKQGATVYYTAITPEASNAESVEPEKATA